MNLYSDNPNERWQAVKSLSHNKKEGLRQSLTDTAPERTWPFGMPTSVNPWIVILGASPGNSPSADNPWLEADDTRPTAGEAHFGLYYQDGKGYWEKVRELTRTVLARTGVKDVNAQDALTGAMNLDTAQSGSANDVDFVNAAWTLSTIRHYLRPKVLVLVGLKSAAKALSGRADLEQSLLGNVPSNEISNEVFSGYSAKNLSYSTNPGPDNIIVTHWPQHPSRSPFSNRQLWSESCEQYSEYITSRMLRGHS